MKRAVASSKTGIQSKVPSVKRQNVVDELEDHEEGEISVSIQEMLGVTAFGSTKNTHVDTNSSTDARGGRAPKAHRKARQYMNKKRKPKPKQPEASDG